jgi:hypothetical protein
LKTGLITGTGRQSKTVINLLFSTRQYRLLVLTRNIKSPRVVKIQTLPNVDLIANTTEIGYNAEEFLVAASRSDFVFVNTDGFAFGKQAETYWGIHLFELTTKAKMKHLIYSGLEYNGKESNLDPKFYIGHYDDKVGV